MLAALVVITSLAVMAIAQAICTRIDDRKFPAPGRIVTCGGRHVHVQMSGSGQPMVLLEAGIAASSLNWSLAQPRLAAFTTVCAYDRAGFGWSSSAGTGCSLARISDELHQLVAALAIERPYIIVAHSFGALIVTAYAQRFADELAGVVLVDPLTTEEWLKPTSSQRWILRRGVWFSRLGGVLAAFGVVRFCLWLLDRGRLQAPRGVLRNFGTKATETVERILGELIKLPPETIRLIRARWSTPRFFGTMAAYIKAVPRCSKEMNGQFIPAQIPVTVLSGAHQSDVRLHEQAAIAAHSSRGRHLAAPHGAHWIHLDHPEMVAQAVREMAQACTMPIGIQA
jgi:pimeloyl-ACP methyl ester carboxylesterase